MRTMSAPKIFLSKAIESSLKNCYEYLTHIYIPFREHFPLTQLF
jgi:hypothetical protein